MAARSRRRPRPAPCGRFVSAPPSARVSGPDEAQLSLRKTHQLLPAAGQRRHPAADRRRVPGVQRRPAVRSLPDLRRQDAGAGERHDHRPDRRRRADAGRPRRLRHRADGARAGRLRHQHRRESLSRPPLRAELHAAPRLAVRRTTSSCTRTASSASTTCCFRRPCCSRPTPTSATSSSARGSNGPMSTSEFHYRLGLDLLERQPGCEEYSVVAARGAGRRADLHVVAGRQLDRHEHRLSRADERQRR